MALEAITVPAAQRKRGGRLLFVASSIAGVWAVFAVISITMQVIDSPGFFSLGFLGIGLGSAILMLPFFITHVGVPALVALAVGGLVSRRAHRLPIRFAVIAVSASATLAALMAVFWTGQPPDVANGAILVVTAIALGLCLATTAVLPWRGGFGSRRYDPEPIAS